MEKTLVYTNFKSRIIRKPRQRWYKNVKIDERHWNTREAVG